jgi:uncharacterized protein YggE
MTYYDQKPGQIAVSVRGSAETKFTSVSFQVTIVKQNKQGPAAKAEAETLIGEVKKVISSHAKSAEIDTTRIKTTFPVEIYHSRHTGEFAGYQATWTCNFTAKNVGEATRLYDALTSIDGPQAKSPTFHVSAEVHARAFQDAWAKAKARFSYQCGAVGQKFEDYELLSWHIHDDTRPAGKMLALSAGSGSEDGLVSVEPGKAILDIGVNFVFVKKKPTP